jgi:hypothetical protein
VTIERATLNKLTHARPARRSQVVSNKHFAASTRGHIGFNTCKIDMRENFINPQSQAIDSSLIKQQFVHKECPINLSLPCPNCRVSPTSRELPTDHAQRPCSRTTATIFFSEL